MAKMIKRLSNTTVMRFTAPSSPDLARNVMNFRFNHLTQRNTLPNVLGGGRAAGVDWGPCNASGTVAGHVGVGETLESGSMSYPRNDPGNVKV